MDWGALMQIAISMFGEEQAKKLSARQLRILEQQLSDVRGIALPDLPEIQAEELGDSAVAGMRSDPELKQKQLQAIATFQNIIDQGGLDLTDRAALEEALSKADSQQQRARAGVAADAAARGQLNSGARLVMDMNAAQVGANAARKTGTEVAAEAQRRRLQAIREAAAGAAGLREQDWREAETANRAKDIRDERNAAAREKANLYNAGLPQQGFNNALAKATGQLPSTSAVGNALSQQTADTRALHVGLGQAGNLAANSAYGNVNTNAAAETGGSTYSYDDKSTRDLRGERGGYADLSEGDEK